MISCERYAGPVNGRCEELFPSAPREVAGGPVGHPRSASSRTIDPADYEMTLTGYEHTSLERIFATGICGWSQPGVEQTESIGVGLQFNLTQAGCPQKLEGRGQKKDRSPGS